MEKGGASCEWRKEGPGMSGERVRCELRLEGSGVSGERRSQV